MNRNEFFVGYLPMPGGLRRTYWILVPLLLIAALSFAVALGTAQSGAGQGRWDAYGTDSVEGYLTVDPYPVLHRADGSSVLLVRAGKLSAREFTEDLAGQYVTIKGAPVERGGWSMLELYDAADVQRSSTDEMISLPAAESSERITLSGEIIDSKCFLGVMKPGAGKVHRACAAMCLTGGIPPMLVVTDEQGDRYGYMLVMPDGSSASRHLVPDVAVPVTVSGRLQLRGDLTYLYLDEDGVRRISG